MQYNVTRQFTDTNGNIRKVGDTITLENGSLLAAAGFIVPVFVAPLPTIAEIKATDDAQDERLDTGEGLLEEIQATLGDHETRITRLETFHTTTTPGP